MAEILGNVFGAVDTNGDAMVVIGHRDQWGTHTILLPANAARELGRMLLAEAAKAEAISTRLRAGADAPPGGKEDKPS